ncbi:ATP-binding cassette domain-containing protein [Thermococcus nautili]|uniref:ATP-binding cassette domain-containing protein n=1 Tax=Thermococcus nautili TaxID=195522 RepID=UPI0025554CA7|nr:hypothetical protein [Thermococcus nautili]
MEKSNVEFILDMAEELRRENVRFFFLDERWIDEGRDIDLCLHREDTEKFDKIARKMGFRFLSKFPPWKRFYVTYRSGDIILLDVHLGKYEGVSQEILGFGESYWLDPTRQVFYYIYRIGLGEPITKYEKYMKMHLPRVDFNRLEGYLRVYFRNSKELVDKLKGERFNELKPEHRLKHTLTRGLYFGRNTLFKTLRWFWRLFHPAPHVVFLGPNGSGKTTLAKAVVEVAKKGKFKPYYEYGGRYTFRCLKPLNWARNKAKKEAKNVETAVDGGRKKEIVRYNSRAIRLVIPFIYYIEYLLRTLCIYPKRLKYKLVVTDRWFYDLITSPNASKGLTRTLSKLLPKPTLVVYVYNDPDVLVERRKGLSRELIENQLRDFELMSNVFDLRVKSDSKERALEEVMNAIIERL